MICEIKRLVEHMENLTLDAGVGAARYKALGEKLDKKRAKTLERTYDFLCDVHIREFAEVERIWTLPSMTPDVWFNYLNLFGDTVFEEVALLKKARKDLKKAYVEFFKSAKKPKKVKIV
jgi:hypothetical protein